MAHHTSQLSARLTYVAGLILLLAQAPVEAATTITTTTGPSEAVPTNAAPAAVTPAARHGITFSASTDIDDTEDPAKPGEKIVIKTDRDHEHGWDLDELLIPLAGIAGAFGTPILVVFFVCYFKYRRRQENLALARDYLNKGLPVPPELLGEWGGGSAPPRCASSDLTRGFPYIFVGLGIMLAFLVAWPHESTWGWGLIPFVIGLGYLTSAWVQRKWEAKPGTPPSGPTAGS